MLSIQAASAVLLIPFRRDQAAGNQSLVPLAQEVLGEVFAGSDPQFGGQVLVNPGPDFLSEFFEVFCSVDGVGMRKALRAMVRPVREVASLIEQQDAKGLSTLPGIGPAMAERIIAKLRRKMPKFALLVSEDVAVVAHVEQDLVRETFEILCQLGHNEADAHQLIETALAGKKKHKDVDSLLQAIYQQTHA